MEYLLKYQDVAKMVFFKTQVHLTLHLKVTLADVQCYAMLVIMYYLQFILWRSVQNINCVLYVAEYYNCFVFLNSINLWNQQGFNVQGDEHQFSLLTVLVHVATMAL